MGMSGSSGVAEFALFMSNRPFSVGIYLSVRNPKTGDL
jgi:hypothetical protein